MLTFTRLVAVLSLAVLVAGCASMIAPTPPAVPAPKEVRAYFEALHKLENGQASASTSIHASGPKIATAGYALVDTQCDEFFSSVARWTSDTAFNRKELTLAGAAAAGILAAVGASAKSIAITSIGVALAVQSLDNFQNFALFTPDPNGVSRLVNSAMLAYRQSAPPGDGSIMADVPTAQLYVAGYARLCTYAGIQNFVAQAIAKAEPVDENIPKSIFSQSDRLLLAGVNTALGLSPDALLTDEQYVKLYWYLRGAYTDDENRIGILREFSAVGDKLGTVESTVLPPEAIQARRLLSSIAQRNAALTRAADALVEANKPGVEPSYIIVVPPEVTPSIIPNIQIR